MKRYKLCGYFDGEYQEVENCFCSLDEAFEAANLIFQDVIGVYELGECEE